jgi:hypothetical protein
MSMAVIQTSGKSGTTAKERTAPEAACLQGIQRVQGKRKMGCSEKKLIFIVTF